MSNKRTILIIGGILLALCCCGAVGFTVFFGSIFGGVMAATQPAAEVSDKFLTAVKDGNYEAAYNLCSTSLKTQVKSPAGIEQIVKAAQAQPSSWSYSSRNINNNVATMSGSAKFASGKNGTVTITLGYDGKTWLVTGFSLNPL